jgi:SAM-dependent methyltransferase
VSDHRIHPAAGAGFEAAVEHYERGRPSYPDDAVTYLVNELAIREGTDVIDLGAGTGKFTELIVHTGATITALEPVTSMRTALERNCPTIRVVDATAEHTTAEDGSFDAAVAASAFHWFDGERALAEIERVLRPRGALVLMWNVPAGPTQPSIEALERLVDERAPRHLAYHPCDLNADRFASGEWRVPFAGSPFEELREASFANVQTLDRDAFVALLASMGWVADLPDDERLPLLDTMRSLLDADEYVRPWTTLVSWTRVG